MRSASPTFRPRAARPGERAGDAVRITNLFEAGPSRARLLTEPFTGYE
jgi:hypothetical protein